MSAVTLTRDAPILFCGGHTLLLAIIWLLLAQPSQRPLNKGFQQTPRSLAISCVLYLLLAALHLQLSLAGTKQIQIKSQGWRVQ